MWEFIKSVWSLFKSLLGVTKELAEFAHSGADFLHLQTVMGNNSTKIKDKQPLNTLPECKDFSKLSREKAVYVYGIRQLNTLHSVETLLNQHDALIKFVDNLHKSPLKDNYTSEVDRVLSSALVIEYKKLKSGNQI